MKEYLEEVQKPSIPASERIEHRLGKEFVDRLREEVLEEEPLSPEERAERETEKQRKKEEQKRKNEETKGTFG